MKLAIGVMAYDRLPGLERLLKSISDAEYFGNDVDLIISIDAGGTAEVIDAAKSFIWENGDKTVVVQPHNLKTKKHALWFGQQLIDRYDALALFEDDIMVAPGFFGYMKAAAKYYSDNMEVVGVSFYRHMHCTQTYDNFRPIYNGKDVFFLQQSISWGQMWLKKQWIQFMDWLENVEKDAEIWKIPGIPNWFSGFPDTALMKWFNLYCVTQNKYFVEPYYAYSTCFHEHGVNTVGEGSNVFQSPLNMEVKEYFCFGNYGECEAYDSVCEYKKFDIPDTCIDLHGTKEWYENKKYLLTTKSFAKVRPLKTYGCEMKPIELNVIYEVPGDKIRLYLVDAVAGKKLEKEDVRNLYNRMIYEWGVRCQDFRLLRGVVLGKLESKLLTVFKREKP